MREGSRESRVESPKSRPGRRRGRRLGAANTNALLIALVVLIGAGGGLFVVLQRGRALSAKGVAAVETDAVREQDWRQVDPALIGWKALGAIPTGLLEPRGIALTPDQRLVVVGDRALRVMDWQGQLQQEVTLDGSPRCVAVAADGTLYVGLRDHVETYSAQGQRLAQWQPVGPKALLTSIALQGSEVYVGDAGQRVVARYDQAGTVLGYLGRKDPARKVPGLVLPSPHLDVLAAPDGLLLVNNPGRRTVETYDAAGNLKGSWGQGSQDIQGFSGCCNPTDLARLPDGRVVTAEKGLPRVKVYSPAGAFESVVAPPGAFSAAASGIDLAVDADGRVLALDPTAKVIRVFAPAETRQKEKPGAAERSGKG